MKIAEVGALFQLLTITILWLCELVLSVISHSLTLRLCMCHSLVMVMICFIYYHHMHTAPRKRMQQYHTKKIGIDWSSERGLSLWLVVCFTAMVALCMVNFIHAIQMLTHRHDIGVHNPFWLLALASVGFVIKLLFLAFGPPVFESRLVCGTFYTICSASVFAIALLVVSQVNTKLVLYLDPAFTVVAAIILAASVYKPIAENIMILMLAVPQDINVQQVVDEFHDEFNHVISHEVKVWRESKSQVSMSLHVTQKDECSDEWNPDEMIQFLKSKGIDKVLIQPEYYTDIVKSSSPCTVTCRVSKGI